MLIVNVKPVDRLAAEEVAAALAWAGRVFADRGWAQEVWSGADPDAIDPIHVQAALARQQTPRQTAAELGITLEHLRHLARRPPPERAHPSAPTAPPRVRLATLLGPEQLHELINQGDSLRQIEARHGISRKTIRDELVAHGIPTPAGPRHHQASRRAP